MAFLLIIALSGVKWFNKVNIVGKPLPKRPKQTAEYLVNYVPYTNLCKHTSVYKLNFEDR